MVEIDELILHQLAASLAVSEVSDVKNPDQDEVSSKMKVSRSATENCSSNCDEGPQDCEMPQGFECELIAPSNTQEDKPEMLNSPSTSKENRPPETSIERNVSTVEESSLVPSGTQERPNGLIPYFAIFKLPESDQKCSQKDPLSNDVETPIPNYKNHEEASCHSERSSKDERHKTKVTISQRQVEHVSLCPEVPKLLDEDETHDLGLDAKCENHKPMDMVQQVALLCIPELVRAQKEVQEAISDEDQLNAEAKALFEAFLLIICSRCQLEPNIELTKDVVVRILERLNESWPDYIVDEMCQQIASNDVMGELPLLTADTLMKALTNDVQDFPTEREFLPSTHWKDALSRKPGAPLNRIFTASNLDYSADTYSSFWWASWAWLTLVITVIAYMLRGFTGVRTEMGKIDCNTAPLNEMGCRLANSLILWFEIFVQLTVIGVPFIYLSTVGNSVHAQRRSLITYIAFPIGIVTVVFYTVVCYSVEFDNKVFSTEKLEDRNILYNGSLLMGIILVIIQVGHFMRLLLPSKVVAKAWFKPFASGMVRMERWTKLSAAFKVQCMLSNALCCHGDNVEGPNPSLNLDEKQNQRIGLHMALKVIQGLHADHSITLLRFQEQVHLSRKGPGRLAIWRQVWSKQIQKDQGIWISPYLGSSNMMQWLIVALLPVAGNLVWIQANHIIDSKTLTIPDLTIWNLRAFIIVGGLGAFLGATYVAASYVPGAISLTMQFRTGLLGSLRDEKFLMYRKAQETRTMLYGATVWGLVLSVILLWISFGLLAFLISYDVTRFLVTSILINVIGFLITWMIKEILLRVFRRRWYRGFYRCKPANANILNVVMDCWNLGFSSMFIVARFVKVFLCLAVNFGRVDVPFLSTDLSKFGSINLDDLPMSFRKDLLIHEAHRHPYIERLGLLYLLKLRLGRKFGTRSGGAWRILFVLAVMPWLKRYRKASMLKQSQSSLSSTRNQRRDIFGEDPSTSSMDVKTDLVERSEQLERENAYLRHKLAQYEMGHQQRTPVHSSILKGTF